MPGMTSVRAETISTPMVPDTLCMYCLVVTWCQARVDIMSCQGMTSCHARDQHQHLHQHAHTKRRSSSSSSSSSKSSNSDNTPAPACPKKTPTQRVHQHTPSKRRSSTSTRASTQHQHLHRSWNSKPFEPSRYSGERSGFKRSPGKSGCWKPLKLFVSQELS